MFLPSPFFLGGRVLKSMAHVPCVLALNPMCLGLLVCPFPAKGSNSSLVPHRRGHRSSLSLSLFGTLHIRITEDDCCAIVMFLSCSHQKIELMVRFMGTCQVSYKFIQVSTPSLWCLTDGLTPEVSSLAASPVPCGASRGCGSSRTVPPVGQGVWLGSSEQRGRTFVFWKRKERITSSDFK